jgi:hypothetical protein
MREKLPHPQPLSRRERGEEVGIVILNDISPIPVSSPLSLRERGWG